MKDPEIHHEVLFEDEINTLKHESLFVDQAYGKRHFLFALIILLLAWGILMGRAVWMQVWQGGWYQGLAEANRLRSVPIWPRRGRILDRQNHVLADNVARFQVTLTPHDLPHDEDAWSIEVGEAARLLGRTIQDFSAYRPRTAPFYDETILAADSLTYKQAVAFAVALPHLQGFELAIRPRRRYPFSFEIQSLSHVLGYVGKLSPEEYIQDKSSGYRHVDEKGKAGVERSLEQGLRGTVGEHVSEVDARGRVKALVGDKPASDGQDIQLSLDLDLQRSTEQALSDELRAAHIDRGAAIAMDPRDGSILALVSLPAYDNNIFSGSVSSTVYQALLDNPNQPLFPRAWAGTYPSGSTVKIVISVAALAEKVITPYTTVLSVGGLKIGPWFFPDWKAGGHGVIDVRRAIAWSVNTF
ncbi:hypothetical protein EXS71_04890, partial [Candidatus Uhrbacteria bacterium]|nr:hypothetical protein [Candidatus Uhrbacteria bacterium]